MPLSPSTFTRVSLGYRHNGKEGGSIHVRAGKDWGTQSSLRETRNSSASSAHKWMRSDTGGDAGNEGRIASRQVF